MWWIKQDKSFGFGTELPKVTIDKVNTETMEMYTEILDELEDVTVIPDRPEPWDDYLFDEVSMDWITKPPKVYSKQELKAIGKDYNGFMIPFTQDDAIGMMQVSMAFQLGITNTVISFSNGTNMPIINTDFMTFALWFAENRNSFFLGA